MVAILTRKVEYQPITQLVFTVIRDSQVRVKLSLHIRFPHAFTALHCDVL